LSQSKGKTVVLVIAGAVGGVIFGLVTGGFAIGFSAYRAKAAIRDTEQTGGEEVVVASRAASAGTTLTVEHLARRTIPKEHLWPNAMKATEAGALVGRELTADVVEGDVFLRSLVAGGEDGSAAVKASRNACAQALREARR
jgi:Flp pilus assembly protein CpaB